MFELSKAEWDILRCNFSTSNTRGGSRYLPFAFTEQGVAMLSSVLNSVKAIDVNIAIMRAFVFIRQYALTHSEFSDLTNKIKELESLYNKQFEDVNDVLNFLLQKDQQQTEYKERKRIGFDVKDPKYMGWNKFLVASNVAFRLLGWALHISLCRVKSKAPSCNRKSAFSPDLLIRLMALANIALKADIQTYIIVDNHQSIG